jgi:hypothetical protein
MSEEKFELSDEDSDKAIDSIQMICREVTLVTLVLDLFVSKDLRLKKRMSGQLANLRSAHKGLAKMINTLTDVKENTSNG